MAWIYQPLLLSANERTATLAVTLDDVTLAATATVDVQATAAIPLDDVALVATATVVDPGGMVAFITLDDVTLSAQAGVDVQAQLAQTLDDVVLTAAAIVTDGPPGPGDGDDVWDRLRRRRR